MTVHQSPLRLSDLLDAAERVCDHYDDNEQARHEMRSAVLATPPLMRADLLAHFNDAYPASGNVLDGPTSDERGAGSTDVAPHPKNAPAAPPGLRGEALTD